MILTSIVFYFDDIILFEMKVGIKMDSFETNDQNELPDVKSKSEANNSITFFDLMPVNNLSENELRGYKEALDFAIYDDRIKNVAITGAYGSGKSSVLESYKTQLKKDPEGKGKKFLHISLAHFDQLDVDTKLPKEDIEKNQVKLEGQILNQLLHQIDPKKIPQTIFRVKSPKRWLDFFVMMLYVLILITTTSLYFNIEPISSKLKVIYYTLNLPSISYNFGIFINSVVLLLALGFLIYQVIKLQINRKIIRNFTLKNSSFETNIEIFNNVKDSYFDKYLDDVLYLFKNSEADVVVFEDIDRFQGNSIFEKLKEINTLVNNKLRYDKKSKQVFLYLLKDDTFFSKDRTKFFDFLISIVPVMTGANAYEMLLKYIEDANIETKGKALNNGLGNFQEKIKFDKSFLQKVTLYIDDLRLLKNIINEYQIYNTKIDLVNNGLDINDLLAMIIYKNIFPSDYSSLLLNKGFVFSIIADKENITNSQIEDMYKDIFDLNKGLEKSKDEELKNIADLELLMLIKNGFSLGRTYSNLNVSSEELIEKIKSSELVEYRVGGASRTDSSDSVFERIHSNPEFKERKKSIQNKCEEKKRKIELQINDLETRILKIQARPLKSVISREEILRRLDDFSDMKKSQYIELLIYLITSGHISESYSDYMTFFYGKGMRNNDKIFLRSLVEDKPLSFSYSLTKDEDIVNEVLSRIVIEDYLKPAILNFDLFTFLLERVTESTKLKNIFLVITENIDFLIQYYQKIKYSNDKNTESTIKSLFSKIQESKPQLINLVYQTSKSSELLDDFSYDLIKYSTKDEVQTIINLGDDLQNYTKNSQMLLQKFTEISSTIFDTLRILNVTFINVDFSMINTELADFIIEENLYEIRMDNINSILEFYDRADMKDIFSKNLTLIKRSSKETFRTYIENNFEKYLTVLDSSNIDSYFDESEVIYNLLNNETLSQNKIKNYLKKNRRKDGLLTKINGLKNKSLAIVYNFAKPDYSNILFYFKESKLYWDSTLTSFANKNEEQLELGDYSLQDLINKNGIADSFPEKTILNNDLKNTLYKKILSNVNYRESDFSVGNISIEKMNILIEINKIVLNPISLATFRKYYPSLLTKFISKNLNEYLDYLSSDDQVEYIEDEIVDVISKMKTGDSAIEKKILSSIPNVPISIQGLSLTDLGISLVIKNNIDKNDIENLLQDYDSFGELSKKEIVGYAKEMIEDETLSKYKVDKQLIIDLLNNGSLDYENKQFVLANFVELFSISEMKFYLEKVDLKWLTGVFNNKRPRGLWNLNTKKIIQYLKTKNIVSSYHVTEDKVQVIPKRNRD